MSYAFNLYDLGKVNLWKENNCEALNQFRKYGCLTSMLHTGNQYKII